MVNGQIALSESNLEKICTALIDKLNRKGIPNALSKREDRTELFQRVYREFSCQEILQRKFNRDFTSFLNELLFWSYQLRLKPESIDTSPEFEETQADKHRFTGKVDLFCLIDHLMKSYPQKYQRYDNFNTGGRIFSPQGELLIRTSFNENFWDNIFNDYDQYRGLDNKEICIFNRGKHALSSYLHSADHYFHYLNLRSLNQYQRDPLCTAILIEAQGRSEHWGEFGVSNTLKYGEYLMVEGVVGNLKEVVASHREQLLLFLWASIQKFAHERNRRIFVNTSHSGHQEEPELFLELIARQEGVPGRMVRTTSEDGRISSISFKMWQPEHLERYGDAWFTHQFFVPVAPELVSQVTNTSRNVKYYNGEQYAETFVLSSKVNLPKSGEFCPILKPEGYTRGFEISNNTNAESLLQDHGISSRHTLEKIAEKKPITPKLREETLEVSISSDISGGLISSGAAAYSFFTMAKEREFSVLYTLLGVAGIIFTGVCLKDLFKMISLRRDYKRGVGCPSPGQFYYLEGNFTSQATIVEKKWGHLVEPASSLKELEWHPQESENPPYRFLDHLLLKEVNLHQYRTTTEEMSGWEEGGTDTRVIYHTGGSFLAERFGERRRIKFNFCGDVPAEFSKLLEHKDKEIALLYAPPQYYECDDTRYPLNVVQIYQHNELEPEEK